MKNQEQGSGLIEMALTLPIVLLVSVVIIQFGVAAFAGAAAEAAARQAFLDDIEKVLKGAANAGSVIWSESLFSERIGKELPGIDIQPLDYDMKDESLLKLYEKTFS